MEADTASPPDSEQHSTWASVNNDRGSSWFPICSSSCPGRRSLSADMTDTTSGRIAIVNGDKVGPAMPSLHCHCVCVRAAASSFNERVA